MELKGNIGNKGIAKGPVRKIFEEEDLAKVNAGDIIVLEQSTAAIIKVINKIAAVITDHGGLTTHAALLSREHNIPCIVGTQNATKMLKEGQEVLVNANIGLVTTL